MQDIRQLAPGLSNAGQPLEDVATAGQPEKGHLRRLAEAGYRTVVDDETFERFRGLMQEPERRPMLVHCSSANRVGALLIPYLILDRGKMPEEAVELASRVGLRSYELKRAAIRYAARQAN
jgi:protein tyrosine phosphatase (PTP) superfamily phosphohydrolase (DUF442 family)